MYCNQELRNILNCDEYLTEKYVNQAEKETTEQATARKDAMARGGVYYKEYLNSYLGMATIRSSIEYDTHHLFMLELNGYGGEILS